MSEPARKIDPASADEPASADFGPVSNKFFEEGDELSKDELGESLDKEPIASTEGAREAKEKKPGRFDFISKFFNRTKTDADKLKSENADIRAGKVGAEGIIPLTEGEKKATEESDKAMDAALEKVKTNFKIRLIGDVDDQLEQIREIGKNLTNKDKNPAIVVGKEDLKIYKQLTKRGAKYENGQYTEASDEEQKRLRELEGPVITKDILAKMAAGEIPWTTNGIFAAASLLHANKYPGTGTRFNTVGAQDTRPGSKIIEGAAVAAAVIGAIASADKAPSPGSEPSKADTEPAKIEKNEAEKYVEVMAAEYRARLDEALEEQTRLTEELAAIRSDLDNLFNGISTGLSPIKRAEAIQKNIELVGKYAKRHDALKTKDRKVGAAIEAMSVSEYLVSVLGSEERVGDSPEYLEKIESLFEGAKQEAEDTRTDISLRLVEADKKISAIEEKLAFYSPEEMPPKSLLRRLLKIKDQVNSMTKELTKETDPESQHAKELAASIAAKNEEWEKLNKVAETKFKAPEIVAKDLTPEAIMQKEKDEHAAELKTITERLAACREQINDLKAEPAPANRAARVEALMKEMAELEAKGAAATERFNALMARIKEAGMINYSVADYGSSATHDASPTVEEDEDEINYSPADTGSGATGGYEPKYTHSGIPTPGAPAAAVASSPAATPTGAAGAWEPVTRIKPKRDSLAADFAEAKKRPATGTGMYRESKAEPLEPELDKDGKPKRENFPPPPNPESEIIVKETYKHAREILAARKEAYRDEITSGDLTAEELKAIKAKLEGLTPENAVKKIFTAAASEELKIRGKNFNAIRPFIDELYRQIIADTDELIALAEKTPATVEPRPNAEPKKFEVRPEVKELVDRIAVKITNRRNNILSIINSANQSKDRPRELLEGIIKSEKDVAEEFSSNEPNALSHSLAELEYFTDEEGGRLNDVEIMAISEQLVRDAKFTIDVALDKLHSLGKIKATEPKPAKPDAKGEREAVAKIMSEARDKIKMSKLDDVEIDDLEAAEEMLKEIKPENLKSSMVKARFLTPEQANQLSQEDIFMLRYEQVAAYKKAIDKKKGVTKTATGAPKIDTAKKEPKEKTEFDLLVDKAKAAIDELKKEGLAAVAELNNDNDLVLAIEQLNRTSDKFDLQKRVTKEDLIDRLAELGILTKEELGKLNDRRLKNLAIIRIDQLTAVKKEAMKRREEIKANPSVKNSGEARLAGAAEPPRPPGKPDKEPTGAADRQAEALLTTIGERLIVSAGSNDMESLKATMDPLATADLNSFKIHLVESGLAQTVADALSDADLERLRGIELTNLQEAYDKAKKLRKKILTDINREMVQKQLNKLGNGTKQITDPEKITSAQIEELSSLVRGGKPGDKDAIALIKMAIDKINGKS